MSMVAGSSPNDKENSPESLTVRIDGEPHRIPLAELAKPETADEWAERLERAEGSVDVDLARLPDWPGESRLPVLDLLASIERPVTYHCGDELGTCEALFDAVLAVMPDDMQRDRHLRARAAALETAALCYPLDDLDVVCGHILERIRSHGIKGVRGPDLVKRAKQIARNLDGGDASGDGQRVLDVLPDAPVRDDAVVPHGWRLEADGITRLGSDGLTRLPEPILITELHEEIREGITLVSVAWRRNGRWIHQTVPRQRIANSRSIVDELAGYSAPVTSNDAAGVVAWLAEYERSNRESLPTTQISHQLGWQDDDRYLLGDRLIVSSDADEDPDRPSIRFRGADGGDDQIAAGYHARGTLEGWLEAIRPLADHPRARLVLYAALVPPLQQMLAAPNFVVDLAGETSTGKTSTLRVAASPWGRPDEQSPSAAIRTWDGTRVYRERMADVAHALPLILDDSKRARELSDVAETIYMVAQGTVRGRGSVKGLARQSTYRTVLLMSGEQPATSFTEDGGTRARVLSLWGSPFGGTTPEMAQTIRQMTDELRRHYGHAGPALVQYVVDHREHWDTWQTEYQEEVDRFVRWAAAGGNTVAGRMASYLAAISMAAWIAHHALQLPWEYEDPIEPLWDELTAGAAEADRAAAALCYVMDWAIQHQDRFDRSGTAGAGDGVKAPYGGWAGRWDKGSPLVPDREEVGWQWIGFIPAALRGVLEEGRFDVEGTLRTWKDRGWLVLRRGIDGEKRRTTKVRIGREAQPVNVIAISRAAVDEVTEGSR